MHEQVNAGEAKPYMPFMRPRVYRWCRACVTAISPEAFSGHSLRAGFFTEAGRQNANLFKMREHSRHASIDMVAEYVRDTERYRDHAGTAFM